MNMQQQGASMAMTRKPAIICQIPPKKQSMLPKNIEITFQAPRKMATAKKNFIC